MPRPFAYRRADKFRRHAYELAQAAEHERDDSRRRHMLDLAVTYERAADAIAPRPPAEPQIFRIGFRR
jgi:hypothetical protein